MKKLYEKMNLFQKCIFGFFVFVFGFFVGGLLSYCSAGGVFYNESLGLFTVMTDNGLSYTFQDKNLGATCTDVTQSCSYGNYYQWGNNYPFTPGGNFSVNYYSPDYSIYLPSTYSSGIFNTNSYINEALWGSISDGYGSMKGPCPAGYYVIDNRYNFYSALAQLGYNSSDDYINYFKFPLGGLLRANDGVHDRYGNQGFYWSSASSTSQRGKDIGLYLSDSVVDPNDSSDHSYGFMIRCFKNSVVTPDSSRTILTGTLPSLPSIDIFYNSDQDVVSILCNGDDSIFIDGLSNYNTVSKTFTPYFNIDYRDEDNQKLVESYDKSVLYLENGQFKKTYTGNNYWILTVQGNNSDNSFSGYLPTFDITGTIEDVSTSGNIFNNFAENSVKFTLSNIPSYIQYVIIIMLLFFVLGIIRKFKRR